MGNLYKAPTRYQADIANYARKHNMSKQQARTDTQFKMLNKEFSSALKEREKLINAILEATRHHKDATDLINKKNILDERLGHLAREIGRKKPDDFVPFGQTP